MFSERVAKLDEMISVGEACGPLYDSLPSLICRLESVAGLHVQAGHFTNSLLQLDTTQSQLSVQMANNQTILQVNIIVEGYLSREFNLVLYFSKLRRSLNRTWRTSTKILNPCFKE